MRPLSLSDIETVSGAELVCTATVSKDPSLSCTGTASDWVAAGKAVWDFLAASPITVPGILERIS